MKTSENTRIYKIFMILFVVITFLLLIYRVTIHADIYDEIINLSISYRIALGDVPFYHCWEAFQSGDIFMAPFIWLYMKIFNTTSGLILYSRIVYLFVLAAVSFACFQVFKKHLTREKAFLLSYIVLFFELYSLFYLWYDTVSVIFFLLGDVFLVYALDCERKLKKYVAFLGAGIVHCCMAFSYPSFALLAILIAIILFCVNFKCYGKMISSSFFAVLWYALGAVSFVSVLLLYVIVKTGIADIYDTFNIIMSTRGANSINVLGVFKDIIVAYVSANQFLIPVTVGLIILYFASLKKRKYLPYLLICIIILPMFNQLFIGKNTLMGLANYLSYLMLWCPFIYFLIDNTDCFDKCLLYIFFLPSMLSGILISMTTVYADIGPVKAWQACLPGALAMLYYMIKIFESIDFKFHNITKVLLCTVVVELLINSYSYIYLNQPYITHENTRITDGLYWGIKVNDRMEHLLEVQHLVEGNKSDCDTILAGGRLRPIYLMSGLKPCVWSVEAPSYVLNEKIQWDMAMKYFDYFEEYPDIIFIEPYEIESNDIRKLLKDKYTLISQNKIGEYDIMVYKKTYLIQ